MTTLADLRALLERALTHAENPAIVRLTDRSVEEVARAYLPRTFSVVPTPSFNASTFHAASARPASWHASRRLDLTDPGTAPALLVALALALGLDPGPLGLQCAWVPWGDLRSHPVETPNGVEHRSPSPRWALDCAGESVMFGEIQRWPGRVFPVPALVDGETDHVRALGLAVRYVLETT